MSGPKFSKGLNVAFNDLGHGRRVYGVLRADGPLIASVADLHVTPGVRLPEFLPAVENACLFAAAPDLFDACLRALPTLRAAGDTEAVTAIKAALKKALLQKSSPTRR